MCGPHAIGRLVGGPTPPIRDTAASSDPCRVQYLYRVCGVTCDDRHARLPVSSVSCNGTSQCIAYVCREDGEPVLVYTHYTSVSHTVLLTCDERLPGTGKKAAHRPCVPCLSISSRRSVCLELRWLFPRFWLVPSLVGLGTWACFLGARTRRHSPLYINNAHARKWVPSASTTHTHGHAQWQ